MSRTMMQIIIDINISEYFNAAKDKSVLHAYAFIQWLLEHYFPTQIRKSKIPLIVKSPNRGHLQIMYEVPVGSEEDENGKEIGTQENNTSDEPKSINSNNKYDDKYQWENAIQKLLKKITIDDLGYMNATELKYSIPTAGDTGTVKQQNINSQKRSINDLYNLEKKLAVKVVFDDLTGHVLLVGDWKKLEKKAFEIRNILSHYHWRLSGKDVAFE